MRLNNDSIPAEGKRLYRFPTSIAWVNDGFVVFEAADPDGAMSAYSERFPDTSPGYMTLANLQVKTAGIWKFASNVPPMFGGYDKRGEPSAY